MLPIHLDLKAPQTLYVCGPTASGKTSFAIELAQEIGGEIVNADAYQLYQGFPIISAAPHHDELQQVPHHLVGALNISETCDAARYAQMAQPVIKDILSRGKHAIVVGGSGLYLKFLTHGPASLPASDPLLRAELEKKPLDTLVRELQAKDPVEANKINLLNPRYVIRSLEICILTNKKVSDIKYQWEKQNESIEASLLGYLLCWDRDALANRIQERTQLMLKSGAIEEVAQVRQLASVTAQKAIGFNEICQYLDHKKSLAETEEQITIHTRQYAKRQRTWFRKEPWLKSIPCPLGSLS